MATKIMLVLDNREDQEFLEKVLERLKYTVISLKKGRDLSEQLIDHFPDVVFASTLGRNQKILNALGKIKEVRGKPKLVFVKQKNESHRLNPEQKKIIDGTIYTPVDPFKLIDILAHTTEFDKTELRRRYNEMLTSERGQIKHTGAGKGEESVDESASPISIKNKTTGKDHFGQTQVFGNSNVSSNENVSVGRGSESMEANSSLKPSGSMTVDGDVSGDGVVSQKVTSEDHSFSSTSKSPLISDPYREKKYKELTDRLNAAGEKPAPIDVQKLREAQSKQQTEVQEDKETQTNRKHFLKTLFSMSPKDLSKKN